MEEDADKNSVGAWIFVSHRTKDLALVRQIRNELERRGHNPLFFLEMPSGRRRSSANLMLVRRLASRRREKLRIMPVIIQNAEQVRRQLVALSSDVHAPFDLTIGNFEDRVRDLVREVLYEKWT
jgi:hypothetical protein